MEMLCTTQLRACGTGGSHRLFYKSVLLNLLEEGWFRGSGGFIVTFLAFSLSILFILLRASIIVNAIIFVKNKLQPFVSLQKSIFQENMEPEDIIIFSEW